MLQTSGWYYPVYPEEYYGSYYDGAANGRPKPKKTRPRKVKGPFAGQVLPEKPCMPALAARFQLCLPWVHEHVSGWVCRVQRVFVGRLLLPWKVNFSDRSVSWVCLCLSPAPTPENTMASVGSR